MPENEIREVTCTKCGKPFGTAATLETKTCPNCGEPVSASQFAANPPPPPPLDLSAGKSEGHAEEPMEKAPAVCSRCATNISNDANWHKCDVCGKYFCNNCPGNHVPSQERELEARVIYKYKPRMATVWSGDVATFYEKMSENVCPDCYEKEYVGVMWKIKWKIKNWKIDMLRDEDMKVIEEIAPGEKKKSIEEDKERAAKAARDLLSHLTKIRK